MIEQPGNLLTLTSHQLGPDVLVRSTHRGSDFENVSMSSRLLQEMLRDTLVTQAAAPATGVPTAAIRPGGHTLTHTRTDRERERKRKSGRREEKRLSS